MNTNRIAFFSAALLGAVALHAAPNQVAQRSDIIWNDSLDWSSAGAEFDYIPSPTALPTTAGNTATMVLSDSGPGIRLDQDSGWLGNFGAGQALLYTDIQNNALDLVFASPIYGGGAEVQPDFTFISAFTARIEAFDAGGASLGAFDVGAAGDEIAFLGVHGIVAEISRLRFSITDVTDADPNDGFDPFSGFAINEVSLHSLISDRVPETGGGLLLLVAGAFSGMLLFVHQRRSIA